MNDHLPQPSIEGLLDRAVDAINRGDRATADALAGRVLKVDRSNPDAEELLASPHDGGEIRRLTMLFADLVDSTALSSRVGPEEYRTVVGRYRNQVHQIVNRYEGHIRALQGDGLLAVFGHPKAHENDAHRAVQAGLDITRAVSTLSAQAQRRFGFDISVRVGVHRGLVYLDTAEDEVYGFGANFAARVCSLAEPQTVAVSETIEGLVRDAFDLEALPPKAAKGVDDPIVHFRVVAERDVTDTTRGPLIGRESEVTLLKKCWEEATDGTLATRGIAFKGEGGIGKTRLAAAALEMATQAGAEVLALLGSPFHAEVGLRPVRRLLERRCGIRRDSDPAESLAKLGAEVEMRSMDPAAVMPLLAPVLGIGPDSGYEPAHASGMKLYEQIAEVIHEYLLACLAEGPGLVLVDDMHWFDEDTVEVVQKLLREDRGDLLVVITGRQLPPLAGNTQILELKALSDAEADELIHSLHPGMAREAQQAIRQRCDGIPLYIEEVVAKLKEQPSDAAHSPQVPETLYETLYARLRSSTNALLVVEAAALIGSRVDQHLLSSVVDLDSHEIADVLGELTRGRVLQPVGKDSWRFHHSLLREVAAELSPPSVRRRLHYRIANGLVAAAADGTPEWPLVAHHYENAERFDEAASAYQKASSDARQRGALGEARNHLTRALANVEKMPADGARNRREVAVRLERGFLASAATGHASIDAAAEFERCLQLIGHQPSRQRWSTLSALFGYYATRGDLRRAAQLVEILRRLEDDSPEWYRATNDAVFGVLAVLRGEFNAARATLEATAATIDRLGSPDIEGAYFAPNDPLAGAYSFVAFARFVQGDLPGAEAAFAQMEARCEQLAFPHGAFSLCYGRSLELGIRAEADQLDRAAELVAELASRGQQYGFDEWMMIAASQGASVGARMFLAAGGLEPIALQGHIDTMTGIVNAWRAFELKSFLAFYDGLLARLLSAAGKQADASQHLVLSLQMADETGMHFYDAELLRIRAATHDDPDAQQADLRKAIEVAQSQGALVYELRATADYFEVVGEPARAALADVINRFPTERSWPGLARARALLG